MTGRDDLGGTKGPDMLIIDVDEFGSIADGGIQDPVFLFKRALK